MNLMKNILSLDYLCPGENIKQLIEDCNKGRIMSVREGKYVGNISPYGYSRIKLQGQKGFTLEILPEESKIVELIYNWYTDIDRIGSVFDCK